MIALPNGWEGDVLSVADAAGCLDGSIATNTGGVILGRTDTIDEAVGAMVARGWKRIGRVGLWKTSPIQPGQRMVSIRTSVEAVRLGMGPIWAHDADADMIGVIAPRVALGIPVFVSESAVGS